MKTLFLLYLLLAATILVGITPDVQAADERVKVGVITALTGGLATIGSAVKNGITRLIHNSVRVIESALGTRPN